MQTLFFILGAVALISGGLVVFQKHPLRSALWLIVNFFAVAGIYLLAHAEFIAAIQVIVYAGAIMVLFLFVIMLLNIRQPEETPKLPFIGQKLAGIILAGFTGLILIYGVTRSAADRRQGNGPGPGQHRIHCPEPVYRLSAALRSHLGPAPGGHRGRRGLGQEQVEMMQHRITSGERLW